MMGQATAIRVLAVFAACFAGAVIASWPLLPQIDTVITSGRTASDLGYAVFAQWWTGQMLTGAESYNHASYVFFPDGQNIAGSVWNFVSLLLGAPLHSVLEPLTAYNASILLIATLNAAAFFGLGHRLGGLRGGIVAATVILALPWMWIELFEGRQEQGLIAPAALYAWSLTNLAARKPRAWLATGAAMALVGATYWYLAPLLAIATLPVLGRGIRSAAVLVDMLRAAGVCLVMIIPFMIPIAPFVFGTDFARVTDAAQRNFDLRVLNSINPIDALLWFSGDAPRNHTLPLVLVLGLAWVSRIRETWTWLMAAVIGLVLCAGPVFTWDGIPIQIGLRMMGLPLYAFDILPGFSRFVWPYRMLAIVGVCAAAALAVGVGRTESRSSTIAIVICLFLLGLEGRHLTFSVVRDGDPQLPTSPLDPMPYRSYFARHIPDWIRDPPTQGGAILPFPLAEVAAYSPMFIPYHRLPSTNGDAATAEFVQPAAFMARVDTNSLLTAWHQGTGVGRDENGSARAIANIGIRWALWFLPDPNSDPIAAAAWRENAQQLNAALGPPVHTEDTLWVWAIR